MDMVSMVNYYKKIFKNPKDILDWIEHDLKHMGLDESIIKLKIREANDILGKV